MASLCKVYSGQIKPKPSELVLDVEPGQLQDFEAAFGQAQTILSSMKGYISHQLLKCLEKPTRYVLWSMPRMQKSLLRQYLDESKALESFDIDDS